MASFHRFLQKHGCFFYVLDVRFKSAESLLAGKRSFIDHHWNIVPPQDSVRTELIIGHRFLDESRYYSYTDSRGPDHFGDLIIGFSKVNDLAKLMRTKNQVYTEFKTPYTGKLRAGISSIQSNYFFGLEEVVDLVLEKDGEEEEEEDVGGVDVGVAALPLLGMTDIGEDEERNQERLLDLGVVVPLLTELALDGLYS